jgi:amino acid transporter
MGGNAQGLVATVGKAVPMVFALGLVAVALVAYGIVRLTRDCSHAGSAYAFVGLTIGPRSGVFAGVALLGAYVFFSICTLAAIGGFSDALLSQLQPAEAVSVPWIMPAGIGAAVSSYLSSRPSRSTAKVLLAVEGIGILLMLILTAVIIARGGAAATRLDVSVFSLRGVGASSVAGGVVAAFMSWAGFEACATLGEETTDPTRTIPLALLGVLTLSGALFVVVMFAETIGFGTDGPGLAAFQRSANTLGSLSERYLGHGFGVAMLLTGIVSAFGCHLSSVTAGSRLIFALTRDGLGPASLALRELHAGQPRNAAWALVAASILVNTVVSRAMGSGVEGMDPAIETFFYFGIAGAICIMLVYLLLQIGVIRLIVKGGTGAGRWELAFPALGTLALLTALYCSLNGQRTILAPPLAAGLWCTVGLGAIMCAPERVRRTSQALVASLERRE